jgi:hypothetical protein
MPTKRVSELEPGDRIVMEGSPTPAIVTTAPHQGRQGMLFISVAYDAFERVLPAKSLIFVAFPAGDDSVEVE